MDEVHYFSFMLVNDARITSMEANTLLISTADADRLK